MRAYQATYRQSLLDIALQECGDVSAVVEIARLNGISIAQDIEAGDILLLPEMIKSEVVRYYRERNITIATQ